MEFKEKDVMKKVLLSLFIAVAIAIPGSAATKYNSADRVQTVGQQLLTKNGIPSSNVKFTVVSDTPSNADFATTRVVNVSSSELAFAGNDNETAAVVANELGHIILGHGSKNRVMNLLESAAVTTDSTTTTNTTSTIQTFASDYQTSKADKDADLVAVNLMVNAGYNPLAAIVVYTKQTGTYWDAIVGRPANAEKALNIYDYISYAYPQKLKAGYSCNEYKIFLTYANTVVSERKSNKKLLNNYNKTYKKAAKTTANKIAKFKVRGGISGWDAVYGLLNAQ